LNKESTEKVLHIYHSFPDAKDRYSFCDMYENGVLLSQKKTKDYRAWPESLVYFKEMFFTLKWIMQSGITWDKYIGMDGLCVLFGNILRGVGKVNSSIFWAIDFVPENRFDNKIKNVIYAFINRFSYRYANEVWDLSPRMVHAREQFSNLKLENTKKHKVVPYGVWLDRIPFYSSDECEQNTLVFMGHLLEKQGAQLVIKAMPNILRLLPNFTFKIIGDGRYRQTLEELARRLRVDEHCNFLGKIEDIKVLEKEIARSTLAIAPYISELDSWTKFADPGKVKTYLACGIPVLLTDVPWNAKEIELNNCGKVITEDIRDIEDKVVSYLNKYTNQTMRENARNYSIRFDYSNIFKTLFDSANQKKYKRVAG